MFTLYHSLISDIKTWVFKKRIKNFRKTKNDKLIIEKNFDTLGITTLASLAWLGIILGCLLLISIALFFVALLIYWFIESPSNTGGIITLIVGALGMIGVIYNTNKKRRDEEKDRYDNSLYIIMQYLIELKRGNYTYKIFKDDLSYIFMNVPNNVLFILRDIQDNIKSMKQKENNDNVRYNEVISKEILFLIIYIREFYHIANAELKNDLEHETIIEDIIHNSSSTKPTKRKKEEVLNNKNSSTK